MSDTLVSNPVRVWTHGESMDITIPAYALEDFQAAYDWKFRGLTQKQRPMSFPAFVLQSVLDGGIKQREYVEAQAYKKMETLCFQSAKLQNITPQEAADKMGFQLKES